MKERFHLRLHNPQMHSNFFKFKSVTRDNNLVLRVFLLPVPWSGIERDPGMLSSRASMTIIFLRCMLSFQHVVFSFRGKANVSKAYI